MFDPTCDNLVGSVIIEICEHIREEKVPTKKLTALRRYLQEGWSAKFREWGEKEKTFLRILAPEAEPPGGGKGLGGEDGGRGGEGKQEETEAERKFRRMREEESYFDRDDDDDDGAGGGESGHQEGPSPYFRQRGSSESGSNAGADDNDDEDAAFDMRLAALQAATKVAKTAKGGEEGATTTKNGKPVLKNLLPYDDSDSD